MNDNELTLSNLKDKFLSNYKDDKLVKIFENIYNIYEQEFLIEFDKFYRQIVEAFDAKKTSGLERELFEYDLMSNICLYIYLRLIIYKTNFEYLNNNKNNLVSAVLISYKNEEEKKNKLEKINKKNEKKVKEFCLFYLDLNEVKNLIESIILQPSMFLQLFKTNKQNFKEKYKKELRDKTELLKVYKKDAIHGREMGGKKLTKEKKKLYENILKLQKENFEKYGSGHQSSLSNSIRLYSKRNFKYWDEKKIKSTANTISKLLKGKKIKIPN